MFGALTSAVDGDKPMDFDPLALQTAGWSEEELAWETCQRQAAAMNTQAEPAKAAELWAQALRLARENFAGNDPRLATSLANHAHALRRAGQSEAARGLFEEALLVWDKSAPWVQALRPEKRARSSTFHLRLESKHPGGYDRHSQDRYQALLDQGRAAILALRAGREDHESGNDQRLARWDKDCPSAYNDARKLMAAALLVVEETG